MWQGALLDIHTTPKARAPMVAQQSSQNFVAGLGITGDRYALRTGTYSQIPDVREVTLIETETLEALLRDHQIDLPPDQTRRNLRTEGVPLITLWANASVSARSFSKAGGSISPANT